MKGYLGIEPALDGKSSVEFDADRVTPRDLRVQLGYQGDETVETPGAAGRLAILVNGAMPLSLPMGWTQY